MTNAEKYLKDGVDVSTFASELSLYHTYNTDVNKFAYRSIIEFLNKPVSVTLTEEERVILRNIDTDYYPTIKKMGRTLYIVDKEDLYKEIEYMFKDHLFKFIKEGEEYEIKELLSNE